MLRFATQVHKEIKKICGGVIVLFKISNGDRFLTINYKFVIQNNDLYLFTKVCYTLPSYFDHLQALTYVI
jgi:hypothetical protein